MRCDKSPAHSLHGVLRKTKGIVVPSTGVMASCLIEPSKREKEAPNRPAPLH